MAYDSMKTSESERDWDVCKKAYEEINSRQVTALMFHDQMADFFDFLGLMGFKRMHEYQYVAESAEHRATKRYFLNHHNRLLSEEHIEDPEVIPDSWYKYTRFDVSTQVRKQAVETAFDKYKEWETKTKECYEKHAKALMEAGYVADFMRVEELICDVDKELKHLERLTITLKSVAYDEVYIAELQHSMHEKYKKKIKKIGVSIC